MAGPLRIVEYELQAGSWIEDSCRDCDRIPIVRDVEGTFLLSVPEDPSAPYELSDIELRSPEGDYAVSGSGLYRLRFDANDDGGVDVSDPVSLLMWLFLGRDPPGCQDAADFNGDGKHDISDAVYGLHFLFLGGPPPPSPGPVGCGPAGGAPLGCDRFDSC